MSTISQPNRAAGGVATWTHPGSGIPVSSTLKFVFVSNGSAATYEVNGTEYPKSKTEFTAAEIGGFFKSFSINNTSGSQYLLTKAVYVDGSLLVDHSSFAVDSSGNDLHFKDVNFGVSGNTSKVWSAGSNMTTTSGNTPLDCSVLFDGSTLTAYNGYQNSTNNYNCVGIDISGKKVEVWGWGPGSGSVNPTINSIEITNLPPYGNGDWTDITSLLSGGGVTTISGFTFVNGQQAAQIALMRIDGEVLIESRYIDAVPDSPITKYATLTSGANGNLEAPINQTVYSTLLVGSKKVYAETFVTHLLPKSE